MAAARPDIHSILYKGDALAAENKPLHDPTKKILRYFPGQAPQFASGSEKSSEGESEDEAVVDVGGVPTKVEAIHSRRLVRLEEAEAEEEELLSDDEKPTVQGSLQSRKERFVEVVERQRSPLRAQRKQAEEIPAAVGTESREEEEEQRERRRQAALKLREQEELAIQQREAELRRQKADESPEEEEEFNSDSSSGSDEGVMLRPVFVPKERRRTAKEKALEEVEQHERELDMDRRESQRKDESRRLLLDALQAQEDEQKTRPSGQSGGQFNTGGTIEGAGMVAVDGLLDALDGQLPDDTDGTDPKAEYLSWRVRELQRLKKDRDARLTLQRQAEEIHARRSMTEEERRLDNARLDAMQPSKEEKRKYKFLQKYYHKGAYFQDQAQTGSQPLYSRDYNAPTADDLVNKESLPRVMRLRRGEWGMAGRTKHTHLADVDTTDFSAPWAQGPGGVYGPSTAILHKMEAKSGGVKGANEFDRPTAHPKKKQRED